MHRSLSAELGVSGDLDSFLATKFESLKGFPIDREGAKEAAAAIRAGYPPWLARCVAVGDSICAGRIPILGREASVGDPVDWSRDHFNDKKWPFVKAGEDPGNADCDGPDVKFIWELSRFHHGTALARAYALTRDEKFAQKLATHIRSWIGANPAFSGPNWRCTMEVAIRAVNLLWSTSLISPSPAVDGPFRRQFIQCLLEHGIHIFHNLEYSERIADRRLQPINGNHYLSDLVGLAHIAIAIPEFRESSKWRELAVSEFYREIRMQVDDDGVHWEYSPGYHRLVLEMALATLILFTRNNIAVPVDIRNRVLRMLQFVRTYTKPSGSVPLIRDIDSGRFCILGGEELDSHRHVLSVGATLFNQADLYPDGLVEDCLWYFGSDASAWQAGIRKAAAGNLDGLGGDERRETRGFGGIAPGRIASGQNPQLSTESLGLTAPGSRLYRRSGFCVLRDGTFHMMIVACGKGMAGHSGHTHNDFLSFELEAYGQNFITDSGSYVYTQNPVQRNRFRSVFSHNTIVIDGVEQNRFDERDLFEIESLAKPRLDSWTSDEDQDVLEASYTLDLPEGTTIRHSRRFVFDRKARRWVITDRVAGQGKHSVEARFHLAPGVAVSTLEGGTSVCVGPKGARLLIVPVGSAQRKVTIAEGWVSPAYARKLPALVVQYSLQADLPYEQSYSLVPLAAEAAPPKGASMSLDDLVHWASNCEELPIGTTEIAGDLGKRCASLIR